MELRRFDWIWRFRVIASVVGFSIFTGLGLHAVMTGWLWENPTPVMILLVAGYLLLPRRALPKGWAAQGEQEESFLREREMWERKVRKVRLLYFFVAFTVLFLVPFALGEPVFRMQ